MTDHSDSQLDDFAQLLQQAHPEPLISDDFAEASSVAVHACAEHR
jgi:hypothetical protein